MSPKQPRTQVCRAPGISERTMRHGLHTFCEIEVSPRAVAQIDSRAFSLTCQGAFHIVEGP